MVVTSLEHAADQIALNPALQKALAFLDLACSQSLPDGRVEIDGNQVYALVQSYDSNLARLCDQARP